MFTDSFQIHLTNLNLLQLPNFYTHETEKYFAYDCAGGFFNGY